jgi:hypothetical protein
MTKSAGWILMIVLMLVLFSLNCRKGNPITPPDNSFALTVDDASCTEVYLNLKIGAGITSRTVTLKRDTITLFTKTIDAVETSITDTSLLPNHTYNYTASLNGNLTVHTPAKTMDTTSNDISWTSYTPGDGSCCSGLYDVQILSDTFAIAVGKIMQGGVTYNAAVWNGQGWELKGVQSIICGSSSYIISSLRTIFAFNDNDIWFSDGAEMIHWNGNNYSNDCRMNSLLTGAIKKIFAINPQDVYAVGNSGAIVHYNGTSWTKIESGTTLDIQNIRGGWNGKTNTWEILAIASVPSITMGKEVLRIENNTAEKLSLDGIAEPVSDIWFIPNRYYITVGSGMYTKHTLNDSHWDTVSLGFDSFYKFGVAGNDRNDLIAVGGYGEVVHFNGIRWKSYYSETQIAGGNYYSVAMRGNLIIAVGETATEAKIAIGRRTN